MCASMPKGQDIGIGLMNVIACVFIFPRRCVGEVAVIEAMVAANMHVDIGTS